MVYHQLYDQNSRLRQNAACELNSADTIELLDNICDLTQRAFAQDEEDVSLRLPLLMSSIILYKHWCRVADATIKELNEAIENTDVHDYHKSVRSRVMEILGGACGPASVQKIEELISSSHKHLNWKIPC